MSFFFLPLTAVCFSSKFLHTHIPAAWEEVVIVLAFRKGNKISISNYRPTAISSASSVICDFVIREHNSHYFKTKLNFSQHGFIRIKSTTMNLDISFNTIICDMCSQGQFDFICFYLSSAFGLVLHSSLLDKLSSYGLSVVYVNWVCSYLTNRSHLLLFFWSFMIALYGAVWRSLRICFRIYVQGIH
jgi:hypothetical protein